MSECVRSPGTNANERNDLRTRIIAALLSEDDVALMADAVIRELEMAIPCTTNGCRMRQIARRHAEEEDDDGRC